MDKRMIEKNLTQWKIEYKKVDEEKSVELFKIKSKYHMLYIKSRGNQFMLNRDYFEYMDSNSIPYVILLHDILKEKYYFLELKKDNNWIKSCFATCDKDNIYLGKQILNNSIDETSLFIKLQKL